jgi:hypothetical protein
MLARKWEIEYPHIFPQMTFTETKLYIYIYIYSAVELDFIPKSVYPPFTVWRQGRMLTKRGIREWLAPFSRSETDDDEPSEAALMA